MKTIRLMMRPVPAYLVLIILLVTAAAAVAVYAAISSAPTRTVTTISGEVFVLTEELTATPQGIGITNATVGAVGATPATNVTMTASGASANTALTLGYFEYRLKIEITTLSAGKTYSVELFAGGISKGKVYIGQGASPVVGNYVTIKWDLGTSLASQVYEVQVLPA